MKDKEVRYLSLWAEGVPGYSADQPQSFQIAHGTPKRGFATARVRATLRGFRINVSVVYPEPEQRKNTLTLARSQVNNITEAMDNLVKTLIKEAGAKDTP